MTLVSPTTYWARTSYPNLFHLVDTVGRIFQACKLGRKTAVMDFAPYQSSPPEHSRVASPDYVASPRHSTDHGRRPFSPVGIDARSPPPLQHPQPQRTWSGFDDGQTNVWTGGGGSDVHGHSAPTPGTYPATEISEFDTSLGLRLDYEAALAYLAFQPLGAIVLLIFERNSDYVRYFTTELHDDAPGGHGLLNRHSGAS